MADEREKSPGMWYLLAEARAPLEAATLVPAMPMLMRAPRGDGHHVVAIPPFGAGDAFTTVLRAYLGRLGYHVHKWGRQEILALHRLSTVAVRRLDELVAEAGGTVSIIGHSLGGIYAREVARAAPDRVRRVITVGSPFAGDLKANVVWPMYEAVTGTRINSIPKEVMARINEPLPDPVDGDLQPQRRRGRVAFVHRCRRRDGRERRGAREATSGCCTTRRCSTSSPTAWPSRRVITEPFEPVGLEAPRSPSTVPPGTE